MNDPSFRNKTKENESIYGDSKIKTTIVEFDDKLIVFVTKDGEMDTSYDVVVPSTGIINTIINEDELTNHIETNCLVGNADNLKIPIMCNQIAKLFINLGIHKNMVITSSSKLWYKTDDDFERLIFILELIKQCY